MSAGQSRVHPFADTELPLVGRRALLGTLRLALDDVIDGRGQCIFLAGESGIGKTRLVRLLAREAVRREVMVAVGGAYAAETGMPYGMISDALVPALKQLPAGALSVLARGAERELGTLLRGLGLGANSEDPSANRDEDRKTRLLWNFAQFLTRLAVRQPLLLVLENAQWSDPSSMELVHFLARQLRQSRVLLIVTYANDEQELPSALRTAERSLLSRGDAVVRSLEPLTRFDVLELLHQLFGLTGDAAARLGERIQERSRGNPLFVDQLIRHLVESGRVWQEGEKWTVADFDDVGLPATIREALQGRLAELDTGPRRLAEVAAVIGGRATLPLLQAVATLDAQSFADAVDGLCARRVLREIAEGDVPHYEFIHPLLQLTVLAGLTAARRQALHLSTAQALEKALGDAALTQAAEIARHLVEGRAIGGDARTLRYMIAAGREALDRHADVEATRFLRDAVALCEGMTESARDAMEHRTLLEDLARALQRTGDREGAIAHWLRALAMADAVGDTLARARLLRRVGLAIAFDGRPAEGLRYLDDADEAALAIDRIDLAVHTRVAKGMLLQALGRVDEAKAVVEAALPIADRSADHALQARVRRALTQLHGWTCPPAVAREHGNAAHAHALASGDRSLTWSTHWALAVLQGLAGNADAVATHLRQAEKLALELRSPLMQVQTAEIAIEHASGIGAWNEGIALAERSIPIARAIAAATLLPRLLVWTGLIRLARDELEAGRLLMEEAWLLSRADDVDRATREGRTPMTGEIHTAILAHTGMAAYWLSVGECQRALDVGQRGLAIADRYGYVIWTIHRLLPIVIEAGLWLQQYVLVRQMTERLRDQSRLLSHRLGMAWAAAAEALRLRFEEQNRAAVPALLAAAEELEAISFPFHAARVRRNAAQVMLADGDLDGAARELRLAHDVFARLGAGSELRGTRSEMRSLGLRLPPQHPGEGAHSLTGRELDIARLAAERLTNKEIAARLDISSRTVSTHLSNMFEKLGVASRAALVDQLRLHPGLTLDG